MCFSQYHNPYMYLLPRVPIWQVLPAYLPRAGLGSGQTTPALLGLTLQWGKQHRVSDQQMNN